MRQDGLRKACAVQDGVLSDSELNDFQVHCFAVPLQPEELAGVKAVVTQKLPEVHGMRRATALTTLTCVHINLDLQILEEMRHMQCVKPGQEALCKVARYVVPVSASMVLARLLNGLAMPHLSSGILQEAVCKVDSILLESRCK